MRLLRIVIAAAFITAGLFAPSALPAPAAAPAGAIGMQQEKFTGPETVTIPRGGSVTFFNDSGWLHVIGPGDKGQLAEQTGTPYLGNHGLLLSETSDTFVAGPWNTPGTYHITCQLHPRMNITVIVTE
jgi:plastocyanin